MGFGRSKTAAGIDDGMAAIAALSVVLRRFFRIFLSLRRLSLELKTYTCSVNPYRSRQGRGADFFSQTCSHATLGQQNQPFTQILLQRSGTLKSRKGSFTNKFLPGPEALHCGGAELPEPLERLTRANYRDSLDGRPWSRDFINVRKLEMAHGIRELHTVDGNGS